MSFLLDPPSLFIIGILLYFIGNKLGLERLAKITIGLLVVIVFISFSILLYADVFRCVFPIICNGASGSDFMFHTDITHIEKNDVPLLVVILLFALYPVFIFLGYASALVISKPRIGSKDAFSYKDVKSRYLFCWDEIITGSDSLRLREYLSWKFEIDWVTKKEANIEKIDDKTIKLTWGQNSILLKHNIEQNTINLEIDSKRTDEFMVKNENGKLNIYKGRNKLSRQKYSEIRYPEYSVIRYPDCVTKVNGPEKATRMAIDEIGGMKGVVKNGDNVLIKINVCGGIPELIGTYTTKEVTGEVVEMVREAGGVPFLCDADMVWAKFWPTAEAEGWVEWAKEKKVKLVNLSETNCTEIVNFDFGKDTIMPIEKVSKEILDADVIISIPAMKTHNMTGVTLGMKNMYGTLPEIDKAKYHKIGIDEVIYTLNNAFTPNLTIIDGSIGGQAGGPLSCESVNYHTIIASYDVVTADSIAAQMMGYEEPHKQIDHIRIAQERGLGDALQKFDIKTLSNKHESDGKWEHPDQRVAKFYVWSTNKFLNLPGWDTFFSISSDFFCYDMASLPLIKYITPAVVKVMNDIGKWSFAKNPDSPENKKRTNDNLVILSILGILSLFGFIYGGYLRNSSLYYSLAYLSSFFLAAFFATRMKTKHFFTISCTTIIVSFLIEYFGVRAGMWHYIDTPGLPIYQMFSAPFLVINIIGFSNAIRNAFAYVELKGSQLRMVPFITMFLGFILFLQFENYMVLISREVAAIYSAFIILSLFHNNSKTLDWNLAVASVSIGCGFITEFLGAVSGLWSYAYYEPLPVFLVISWTFNVWAVCSIAQILNVDLSDAIAP